MATISKPFTFTTGTVIKASEHNSNNDTIYNDYNGNITTANLSATAGIVDTQLAQITTASKVAASAVVGTPWAEGMVVNGFEIAHVVLDAPTITVSAGTMMHGTTQVKTTASSHVTLDTAGNYYNAASPTDYPSGIQDARWNHVGIDSSGTVKLLGRNVPTISHYTTDGTKGNEVLTVGPGGRPLYFWDSGNSKHWRVIGQLNCYDAGGTAIKAALGQSHVGRGITYDSMTIASATPASTYTEINCRSLIAVTSQEGMFNVALEGGTGICQFYTRTADAPTGATGKVVKSEAPKDQHEFIQTTSSLQAMDYSTGGTSPTPILYVTGYNMAIRL